MTLHTKARAPSGAPSVTGDPRSIQWKPGDSGHPKGRAPGFSALIRSQTREGAELVDFMMLVFRKAPLKHRMEAANWLADRGFGRAIQRHDVVERPEILHLMEELGG